MNIELYKKFNIDESATIKTVQHCDFLKNDKCGKIRKTDTGFLVGTAPVAKIGVMSYLMADGTIVRELVPEETLFNKDSMESLKLKPVTDQHPPEKKVHSKNAGFRQIGFTGETIKKEDGMLVCSIVISDQSAVENIERGRQELSPGYEAELVFQPGTFENQQYDAIQVKRNYNHLAIVDNARGGTDIRMNMDGAETEVFNMWSEDDLKVVQFVSDNIDKEVNDAVLSTEQRKALPDSTFCGPGRSFPVPDCAHVTAARRLIGRYEGPGDKSRILACVSAKATRLGCNKNDELNINKEIEMVKIKIDGIEYEAAPEVANFITKKDTEIKTANDSIQTITAERDTLKVKNDELEKRDIQKEVNDAVQSRLELERVASIILDKVDENLDNRGLKVAIIAKKLPLIAEKIDEKTSLVYIDAVLDSVKASFTKEENDSISAQRKIVAKNDGKSSETKNDEIDARNRMIKNQLDAYKQK
jgi:hypothetical protein